MLNMIELWLVYGSHPVLWKNFISATLLNTYPSATSVQFLLDCPCILGAYDHKIIFSKWVNLVLLLNSFTHRNTHVWFCLSIYYHEFHSHLHGVDQVFKAWTLSENTFSRVLSIGVLGLLSDSENKCINIQWNQIFASNSPSITHP